MSAYSAHPLQIFRAALEAAVHNYLGGTDVRFAVQRSTRRRLEEVFMEYAPKEYDCQFQKTKVFVKLLQRNYVSRSEAKRLLANLEKFREVVVDFRDAQSIGQGFADEISASLPKEILRSSFQ